MATSDFGRPSASLGQTAGAFPEAANPAWRSLYRIGGVSALTIAALTLVQIAVYILNPPPVTVGDYFALFQRDKLLGLLALDLLLIVDYVLGIPILLAFYVALRRVSPSYMLLAAATVLLGTVAYFASNPAFEMLALSDQYAAATTEAQRAALLGAGQAMLATYNGTAFHLNYVLGSLANVVIGAVMLRGGGFSRATGLCAVVANVVAFGLYVPVVGIFLSILSVPFLGAFYALAGLRLLQMGRSVPSTEGALS